MTHAYERCMERLNEANVPIEIATRVYVDLKDVARKFKGSVALRLFDVNPIGVFMNPNESNGDEVWCIIRKGQLNTIMLRDHRQNNSKQRLRVSNITKWIKPEWFIKWEEGKKWK